jgi:hypothetical protein
MKRQIRARWLRPLVRDIPAGSAGADQADCSHADRRRVNRYARRLPGYWPSSGVAAAREIKGIPSAIRYPKASSPVLPDMNPAMRSMVQV